MAIIEDRVKIRLVGYDQEALDDIVKKFTNTLKEENVEMSGPIPLPTHRELYTILRSPHKHKDSREQFERRIHKRIITAKLSQKALNALSGIKLPSSVSVSLVLESKNQATVRQQSKKQKNIKRNKAKK
ncbi:30S ribosomal protein S10 [Spiroplasma sp. JKS002669]|nr:MULTISPECIES: 30S ribosomal protein S10 [unclassified Spiroplasma]MCL6428920.1 30S ribosomal protein S10 [Spiroplasma sp. JKS002669]MCL8209772.1 30S ribosomal protein S10 [Spiroplasma sp. JKS002670]MCL8210588.1 30S ribosomal protein S10 [Spiroplasma sp. JKS002671]